MMHFVFVKFLTQQMPGFQKQKQANVYFLNNIKALYLRHLLLKIIPFPNYPIRQKQTSLSILQIPVYSIVRILPELLQYLYDCEKHGQAL